MPTDASQDTTGAGGRGVGVLWWLAIANLGLVALQPVSAGFFLSGYGRAVAAHTIVAIALQVSALVQAGTALVLWRQRRVPGGVAGVGVGFFATVLLQSGLGYHKSFWLHVPLGVFMFGGLMRQVIALDPRRRLTGARS